MNKSQPILSVVIPAWNAEKTIVQCLDSLLNQLNSTNVEIIVIDDGSSDKTGEIIDEYSERYECVRSIHQTNGGLAHARNVGIELSTANFVSFLDSDDYLSDGFIQTIIGILNNSNPDIVAFGWIYNNSIGEKTKNYLSKQLLNYSSKDIRKIIIPEMINIKERSERYLYEFACNKIYKRKLLMEYNLRFNDKRRKWEDLPFLVSYLSVATSLIVVPNCFYNYCCTENSLSSKYIDQEIFLVKENFDLYFELFGAEIFNTAYSRNYWKRSFTDAMINFTKIVNGSTNFVSMAESVYDKRTVRNLNILFNSGKWDELIYMINNKCWRTLYYWLIIADKYRVINRNIANKYIRIKNHIKQS